MPDGLVQEREEGETCHFQRKKETAATQLKSLGLRKKVTLHSELWLNVVPERKPP